FGDPEPSVEFGDSLVELRIEFSQQALSADGIGFSDSRAARLTDPPPGNPPDQCAAQARRARFDIVHVDPRRCQQARRLRLKAISRRERYLTRQYEVGD